MPRTVWRTAEATADEMDYARLTTSAEPLTCTIGSRIRPVRRCTGLKISLQTCRRT
jgi:hypothetical protein